MQSCWSTLLCKHHCNKQSLLRGLQPSKSQCYTYGLLFLASSPKLAPVEETPKPAQPSKLSFHLKVAKIQNFNCYQRTGFLASFFNDKCIWQKGCTKAETMTARDYWLPQCRPTKFDESEFNSKSTTYDQAQIIAEKMDFHAQEIS